MRFGAFVHPDHPKGWQERFAATPFGPDRMVIGLSLLIIVEGSGLDWVDFAQSHILLPPLDLV